eukprot:CAMPEP_0177790342 /NCGR_PEP_ID=MMETSP0491_2-20121128/23292_1 /TAXON_ID=63592 /ORGANISM="Tetraselmis chuii, Strain PLY429" /LENGTH=75 /DNA_ID=CAMNT_0019312387 /DNA_START=185 /DNA_END=409 /DNA_ORIENTATION=+
MTRPGPPTRPTARNDPWSTDGTQGNNMQRPTPSEPRVMLSAGQPVGYVDHPDDYTTESPRSPFDCWTFALSAPAP